jgi:hypothetical protein
MVAAFNAAAGFKQACLARALARSCSYSKPPTHMPRARPQAGAAVTAHSWPTAACMEAADGRRGSIQYTTTAASPSPRPTLPAHPPPLPSNLSRRAAAAGFKPAAARAPPPHPRPPPSASSLGEACRAAAACAAALRAWPGPRQRRPAQRPPCVALACTDQRRSQADVALAWKLGVWSSCRPRRERCR